MNSIITDLHSLQREIDSMKVILDNDQYKQYTRRLLARLYLLEERMHQHQTLQTQRAMNIIASLIFNIS